jgi:N-acetylmuramoyl-L-alanine amidase
MRRFFFAGFLLAAAPALAQPTALAAPQGSVRLTGLRSWSAPTSTRIVMDFSRRIVPVAPDSGRSPSLTISLPMDALERAPGVPAVLRVGDGVVDSVVVSPTSDTKFLFAFADTTRFKLFALPVEQGKPFRLVVDVVKPGGTAAQDAKLATIAAAKRRERVRIIAIDPGHGGDDTGARGPQGAIEKQVNLGVAKALAEALNQTTGIRAVLTRDGDYFIPLRERYRSAERMKADIFISIHANSSKRRGGGNGTEVYFLSMRGASDQATQDLADVENAADLVGGVPRQAEDDLVSILYDVKRTSALQQSQLLAETLLDHLAADRRLEQRGVKQAGFAVLKSVEFPSVLVETAFINNPTEARLLRDPAFQKQIGKQLATGVRAYFERSGVSLGSSGSSTERSQP